MGISAPSSGHHVFRAFLGDIRGQSVLDLGCLDPSLARFVLANDPRSYLGLATSEDQAEQLAGSNAQVLVQDLGRWSGAGVGVFDLAIAAMTLHRVRNLARLLETLHHHVTSGGRLVFSVDHPLTTANPGDSRPSGYFRVGERLTSDGHNSVPTIWHRTLSSYIRELRYCGFRLEELAESGTADLPQLAVFRCVRTP